MSSKVYGEYGELQKPYPSFFKRLLQITPMIEMMGYLKDHRSRFKQAFIESSRHDGNRLKSGMTFMFEMEIILGSLLLAANATIVMSVNDETLIQDFEAFKIFSLGFWITALGAITLQLVTMFVGVVYITIISLQPISPQNFYSYLRTPSCQTMLAAPNSILIVFFYLFVTYICLILTFKSGGSTAAYLLCFLPGFGTFFACSPFMNYHFNLGYSSGAYSPIPIIPPEKLLKLTSEETERILYWRSVENCSEVNADPEQFYDKHFENSEEFKSNKKMNTHEEGNNTSSGGSLTDMNNDAIIRRRQLATASHIVGSL